MNITAVWTSGVKMFVRTIREVMFQAAVSAMFFKVTVCNHVSKFLAVITSNDFNSLLYEVRSSVEKMVKKRPWFTAFAASSAEKMLI